MRGLKVKIKTILLFERDMRVIKIKYEQPDEDRLAQLKKYAKENLVLISPTITQSDDEVKNVSNSGKIRDSEELVEDHCRSLENKCFEIEKSIEESVQHMRILLAAIVAALIGLVTLIATLCH